MSQATEKPHFYTHVEFYISTGAFIISLISVYFTYLGSPLSEAGRPKLTYATFAALANAPNNGHEWRTACEIQNTSNNPADDVIVTVPIPESPTKSKLDILGGLEFSVLEQSTKTVTVKFPHFPPRAGAVVRVFTPFAISADGAPPPDFTALVFFTTVVHKHGIGIRHQ